MVVFPPKKVHQGIFCVQIRRIAWFSVVDGVDKRAVSRRTYQSFSSFYWYRRNRSAFHWRNPSVFLGVVGESNILGLSPQPRGNIARDDRWMGGGPSVRPG